MKKLLKYLLIVPGIGIVALGSYLKFVLPNVGIAPDLKVELSPDRVERGRYLANHVAVCMDCHSTRDWSRFSGPPVKGTEGKGGEIFDEKFGFPGRYTAKNITPAGIGNWTDGEIYRAITTGVNKNGKSLFPVMPYHYYGHMDDEDIKSIIAYLRTLKPIENKPLESVSDFPMNFIINTMPHKAKPQKLPKANDIVNYGKYLANAASCIDCHTKFEKGKLISGTEYGGGREFPFPDGSVIRSANITPDKETGIGSWTKETFVTVFRAHSDSATLANKLKPGEFNTIMPWTMFGKMTTRDLEALFAYLLVQQSIKNPVVKFSPSPELK